MSRSEAGPCQVLPLSFEDQLGTPDLLAVPIGAAFIPAFVPDDMAFAPDDIDLAPDDMAFAPDDIDLASREMKRDTPRPSSSQRAWKAPLVQQATRGTRHPDQRPLSSAELAEAAAFCLPAERTRGLGAAPPSKAEQRPLAAAELSGAASVTTGGTPFKSRRIQRPLASQESNWLSEAPVEASAGTRDDMHPKSSKTF